MLLNMVNIYGVRWFS